MSQTKLPAFEVARELAAFWEAHDLTDFMDELEEVPAQVFERQPAAVIHLEPAELAAVDALARQKGLGREELLRQWVCEQLQGA